jgi:hypothetical protein
MTRHNQNLRKLGFQVFSDQTSCKGRPSSSSAYSALLIVKTLTLSINTPVIRHPLLAFSLTIKTESVCPFPRTA